MPNVNMERAKQMVRASALAYENGHAAIVASPHLADARLINNVQLQQITTGIDSVLVGQTDFGVVVAFRGTQPPTFNPPEAAISSVLDWLNDADLVLKDVLYSAGKVHDGFRRSLDTLWDNGLLAAVQNAAGGGRRVFVTGHSKGGALAALGARRLKAAGMMPAGVITFGAPRVGDEVFANAYDVEIPNHWRFEHQDDVVPHLPPHPAILQALRSLAPLTALLRQHIQKPVDHYEAVGQLCFLDWNNKLDETASRLLEFRREAHLVVAGTELITDHYIDATHLGAGKMGYVETVNQL